MIRATFAEMRLYTDGTFAAVYLYKAFYHVVRRSKRHLVRAITNGVKNEQTAIHSKSDN